MSKETTSNKTKKRVASFFGRIVVYILVLVLIAGIPFAYKFGHSVFYASSVDSPPGRNIQVNVVEGMSFDKLADTLYDKGVIENKFSFEIQARFFDIRMHTGEYTFNTSQTSREILEMIDEGVLEKNINDNKS
jgi:aminodeoxychorismate lyase